MSTKPPAGASTPAALAANLANSGAATTAPARRSGAPAPGVDAFVPPTERIPLQEFSPAADNAARFADLSPATPAPNLMRREEIERHEQEALLPAAAKSVASRGGADAEWVEEPDPFRTSYMRDRDRLIHSWALRRLQGVRQVAHAPGDEYRRTRFSHTMEVAQLARAIAGALRLNADLAEAAALAHDVGHPPFGHDGEAALNAAMQLRGGRFEHNLNSYRVVRFLERYHPQHAGLNLSLETLYCVVLHQSAYDVPEHSGVELVLPPSPPLEGQVVNIADEIAYIAHDTDDAIQAGALRFGELNELPLFRHVATQVSRRFGKIPDDLMRHQVKRGLIDLLVNGVIIASARRIQESGVGSIEEVFGRREPLIVFPEELVQEKDRLRTHLLHQVYLKGDFLARADDARLIIASLFEGLMREPRLLPLPAQQAIGAINGRAQLHQHVCDFIAGMTDAQATAAYGLHTL